MNEFTTVKGKFLFLGGIIFGFINNLLGGYDEILRFLFLIMALDYISGMMLAIFFKKSPKTKNGAMSSKVGFEGICKKIMMIFLVVVAHNADSMLGFRYIRASVILAFTINELVSLTENTGLMGVKIPKTILNFIEILKENE